MRISVSSLAWTREDNPSVVRILKQKGISAIDVTPGTCISDILDPNLAEAKENRDWWNNSGIEIVGMQGLLFGTTQLALFQGECARNKMLEHLTKMAELAQTMGATRLTFGSPSSRDRSGLNDTEAELIASAFFRELGNRVSQWDIIFCIEPSPSAYGCNFLTKTAEAVRFVRLVDHPNVRIQLDTGTIAMNGENPESTIRDVYPVIGHIHLSEPNLVALGTEKTPHRAIAAALRTYTPDALATIEMKAAGLEALERAVKFAVDEYRGEDQ